MLLLGVMITGSCTDVTDEFGFEGSLQATLVDVTQTGDDTYSATFEMVVNLQNIASQQITGAGVRSWRDFVTDTKADPSLIKAEGSSKLQVTAENLEFGKKYDILPYLSTESMDVEGPAVPTTIFKDRFLELTLLPAEQITYNSATLTVTPNDWQNMKGIFVFEVSADAGFTNYDSYSAGVATVTVTNLIASTTYYYRAHYISSSSGLELYTPVMSFTTRSVDVEAVDLGLSVLWAEKNLRDDIPGGKDHFKWCVGLERPQYQYHNAISGSQYDPVTQLWGQEWRMPWADEMRELVEKCTWEPATEGGKTGWKVVGPNGKSIFMPADGYRYSEVLKVAEAGVKGYYWTANGGHLFIADFLEISTADNLPIMDHPVNATPEKAAQMDKDRLLSIRPVKAK